MDVEARLAERRQCLDRHARPEVRATDADGDDVAEMLARRTGPVAAADRRHHLAHATQLAVHHRHHVFALYHQAAVFRQAQGGVEDGAVFGRSEEHTSELQSLMRTSYAVFCLKKKKIEKNTKH